MFRGGYNYQFFLAEEAREIRMTPESGATKTILWRTICPACGIKHEKHWHIETDLCLKCQKQKENSMHYRNGREAKNGDKIIQLGSGTANIISFGVLHDATTGNDYCNGSIAQVAQQTGACMCDCLHVDDLAAILVEKGLDKRPEGK
jgi:hypothetical protein